MSVAEVLKPVHKDVETAYLIEDYPWGFSLRTERKIWIESKGKKERIVIQTMNPKTGIWCKPKLSTYGDICVLFKNDEDHVVSDRFNLEYSNTEECEKFLNKYKDGISEDKLKSLEEYIEVRKKLKLS